MHLWGRRAEPAAPAKEVPTAPAPMDEASAEAIVARFRLALRSPTAMIGRDTVDRAALHDAPARVEAAILCLARARAGNAAEIATLRDLTRLLAGVAPVEAAAQLRAFHAKLPSGEDATMSGITMRIEEAISSTDFVTQAARQLSESRRLTAAFDAAVRQARRG